MNKTIHLISLGCAKNQVNSEQMLFLLKEAGYNITEYIEDADAVVVNTCGFIDSAKKEAIDTILESAQYKEHGKLQALIVTGCLSERYRDEILQELPEVDVVCGTGSYEDIVEAVDAAFKGEKKGFYKDMNKADLEGERIIINTPYSAYIKIAEGCDNKCHYCVIPSLRGSFRSRPMESLIEEAKRLAESGVKELMVVAQDITRYGTDLYGERKLHELVKEFCKIDGFEWIRLHYLYPDEIDDILLETIKEEPKVLKYFDIPIQHISDNMLKAMNRRGSGKLVRERIDKIRALMPDAVMRTSLIVGFPGETEEDFNELYEFLEEYKLERAGVFAFSREEGSVAYDMPDQIDEDVKIERQNKLFKLQTDIMDILSSKYIDKTYKVLCEGYDEEEEMFFGRSYMDSPDIDGIVYFDGEAEEGEFYNIKINDAVGCILYGSVVEEI
ncbi:MAG: 30S ribosomal protein S12 methylthiotransferase RimO [Clostridia bacterium]|nr:30S ribosomal protein S12 methylthiotransferase RimO [Clostridia bacterium]